MPVKKTNITFSEVDEMASNAKNVNQPQSEDKKPVSQENKETSFQETKKTIIQESTEGVELRADMTGLYEPSKGVQAKLPMSIYKRAFDLKLRNSSVYPKKFPFTLEQIIVVALSRYLDEQEDGQ